MKKLVLIAGILASALSVGMGAMSENELVRAAGNCFENHDKSACQALVDFGLPSVEGCNDDCGEIGLVYARVGNLERAKSYFEKAFTLGDNNASFYLGFIYDKLNDYVNAKKHYEIACNEASITKAQAESCYALAKMYIAGGVRQDFPKAKELLKKACDMELRVACAFLRKINGNGQRFAKEYLGKECDLGDQKSCDMLRILNREGVQ